MNWRLVTRPLDRASQLDMRGNPDSGGVWAPCLSYADGKFWLVYTDVKRLDGNFKDTHNYIVTAPAIEGPWSDPVYVNSSGFDPSLFHDDDGKKWFLNMLWNHVSHGVGGSPKHPSFAGILLQQYDPVAQKLVGPVKNVFAGSPHGLVEGSHLFKRDGWYYMTTAEGGTGYDHAVTMARSRKIDGPYELHPDTHLMTSKDAPDAPLQRAGHGQIVETPDGEVYHTHLYLAATAGTEALAARPRDGDPEMRLGRGRLAAAWHMVRWCPRSRCRRRLMQSLLQTTPKPATTSMRPTCRSISSGCARPFRSASSRWPTGPAICVLFGRESIGSFFEQALVARRQQHFEFRAETELDFAPDTFQQAAGLVLYYNRHKFHFLAVTHDARLGRVLTVMNCLGDWPDGKLTFPLPASIPLADGPVALAADIDGAELRFSYRNGREWLMVGPTLDASIVSDEAGRGEHGSFTGAFVGMVAFDTSGTAKPADFDYFSYLPA